MEHLGFTGTRQGMTGQQLAAFKSIVIDIDPVYFHHGMCIGADTQAHDAVWLLTDAKIIGHPPIVERYKTTRKCTIIRVPRRYMQRNQDIVDECEMLIATPKEDTEQLRSGTWGTVRRARKKGIAIVIINPDGSYQPSPHWKAPYA